MKFKTIFIIFNLVIIFSFLVIFFMPLFLLGKEYFITFLLNNWYISILFLITIVIFNSYFIHNWNLFQLLEREDWVGLISYLENRIYKKNYIRKNNLKILMNSYLVTSNAEGIFTLKEHVEQKKPLLAKYFAISFGLPYLLLNRPSESERYFGKLLSEKGVRESGWIHWNYAFSLMQLKEMEGAKKEYTALIEQTKDQVLLLLSLYMLNSLPGLDLLTRSRMDEKIDFFQKQHSRDSWLRKMDRYRGNLQTLILSKIIMEAGEWVFQYKPAECKETVH
jgi:hypothetical protein